MIMFMWRFMEKTSDGRKASVVVVAEDLERAKEICIRTFGITSSPHTQKQVAGMGEGVWLTSDSQL